MLPKTNKTVKTTKVAKTDQIAETAKLPKIAKTATTAKAVKTGKVAKVDKIAKPDKIANGAKIVKTDVTKLKRLSAGQRIHERRMKQAARKEGTVYRSLIVGRAPVKKTEK